MIYFTQFLPDFESTADRPTFSLVTDDWSTSRDFLQFQQLTFVPVSRFIQSENRPIKIWKNVLKIWLQSVGVEQQQLQEQSQMLVSWKYKKIFAIRPNGMYDDMYLRIWISRSGAHRKSCMGPV